MNGIETWSELALEMGVSVDTLLAQMFPVCPRSGKPAIDKNGKPIDCEQCAKCGELPF